MDGDLKEFMKDIKTAYDKSSQVLAGVAQSGLPKLEMKHETVNLLAKSAATAALALVNRSVYLEIVRAQKKMEGFNQPPQVINQVIQDLSTPATPEVKNSEDNQTPADLK